MTTNWDMDEDYARYCAGPGSYKSKGPEMSQKNVSPYSRIGTKRWTRIAFPALHVITNVRDWHSGMTGTSECGLVCDVLEDVADDSRVQLCERCRHSLGWDL